MKLTNHWEIRFFLTNDYFLLLQKNFHEDKAQVYSKATPGLQLASAGASWPHSLLSGKDLHRV